MKRCIYVIEMQEADEREYEPTEYVTLHHDEAELLRDTMRDEYPTTRFRVVRYVPAPVKRRASNGRPAT